MEMRRLGPRGELTVSLLGLGCNNFGERLDQTASAAVIDAAIEAGVTLFDTAPIYAAGRSEEILGEALRGRRSSVVVATKFGYPTLGQPRGGLAAPSEIKRQLEDSLRRLRTDYIDLYQLHLPDPDTPWEETLEELDRLQRSGKIRAAGASNLVAAQVTHADELAAAHGHPGFVCHQNELSLLKREAVADFLPALEERGLSFLPYFPLANGLLSGKYRDVDTAPPGSRLALNERWRTRYFTPTHLHGVHRLEHFAQTRGRTLLELAFGWLAGFGSIASVIAGAMTPEQVATNSKSIGWRPDRDEVAAVLQ